MPGGRPTKYDPAYCDQVIEWGKQGKSKTWMAGNLGVVRQTLEEWSSAHPEFLDAITRAMTHSQIWWEDAGQSGMTGDKFNSSVWSRSMAARFPEEWREVKGTELSAPGGGPVQLQSIERVITDPSNPNSAGVRPASGS